MKKYLCALLVILAAGLWGAGNVRIPYVYPIAVDSLIFVHDAPAGIDSVFYTSVTKFDTSFVRATLALGQHTFIVKTKYPGEGWKSAFDSYYIEDSAVYARTVWDNDIVAQANRNVGTVTTVTNGVSIASGGIPVGAFASASITADAIAPSAIGESELAANCITNSEIANSAAGEIRDSVWAATVKALTDKAGFSLAVTPFLPTDTPNLRANIVAANWAAAIGTKTVTVTTNNDKTGYATTVADKQLQADTTWGANHITTRALIGAQTVTIPTVTTVTDMVDANVTQVSDDAAAATKMETMFDSNGVLPTLFLGGMFLSAAKDSPTVKIINTVGDAMHIQSPGDAVELKGTISDLYASGGGFGIYANIYGSILRTDSIGAGGPKAFWNLPFATSFVGGSMGDSLNNKTYVQGPAGDALDSTETYAVVFAAIQAGSAGTGLDSAKTWQVVFDALRSYVADSTIDQDTLRAIVWDIFVEFMHDSTMSQSELWTLIDSAGGLNANDTVKADVVKMAANVITSQVMAANTIGASQLAGDAAREIADTANNDSLLWPTVGDIMAQDSLDIDTSGLGKWMVNNIKGDTAGGTGPDRVRIYAVDTLGTDSAVAKVDIGIYYYAGQMYAAATTGSAGYIDVYTTAPDSYYVQAGKMGYTWTRKLIVVDSNETDSIFGANVVVGVPDSTNMCRVYGYVYALAGVPREGAKIVASLSLTNAVDSCAGVGLDAYEQQATTDATGYWYIDLVKTKCIDPASTYTFKGYYPAGRQISIKSKVTVPDSSSYKLVW